MQISLTSYFDFEGDAPAILFDLVESWFTIEWNSWFNNLQFCSAGEEGGGGGKERERYITREVLIEARVTSSHKGTTWWFKRTFKPSCDQVYRIINPGAGLDSPNNNNDNNQNNSKKKLILWIPKTFRSTFFCPKTKIKIARHHKY